MTFNLDKIDELSKIIIFLFYKLKKKDMSITKFRLIKSIFKIKVDLGKNHELYDILPFYWYYYGPFSEHVNDSFYNLRICFVKNGSSFQLSDNILDNLENSNESYLSNIPTEVDKTIDKLIENSNYFYNDLHRDIYWHHATYKCLYPFKFNIFDIADKKEFITDADADSLVNTFFEIESTLPFDAYFNNFSDIFSSFTTQIDSLNQEQELTKQWDILKNPITNLWCTFAKGLRVRNRDKTYNSKEEIWDNEFKRSEKSLNSNLKLLKTVFNKKTKTTKQKYLPSEKKLLLYTLGNYLEG
jgi:hypothetical protein